MVTGPEPSAGGQPPINAEEPDVQYLKKQVMALVGLLSRKGVVPYGEFLAEVHRLEEVDHRDGARVVARAWTDPAFKERLLQDPADAVAEMGIRISGYQQLDVVENTERLHHVVVCTTCSCVPSPLSGFTPDWYKSAAYRARVVREPRTVLREFGLELPEDVEVRVIDTDARHRCMVLPKRPAGAEGLDEARLSALVTQESLFGVGQPISPS
ncbi:MAG TPA: nitrile hydratase subunit alpha [Chloroflexota bacterium]|nr:nitrile hydratase subunit alpha [Chloroflexota bacterium]